ncbi:hypothetical protein ACFQUU_01240 [Herbaspirillum sp. GCM10030257]|uniref:hypothetical protein n=1 Tax=Herbaspirillum sp. GCM10030257 TaxID=3273393 RepID=UPI003622B887
MQRSLLIEPNKYTGCLQCEMACSYENYGAFNPAKSRIKVFECHQTSAKVVNEDICNGNAADQAYCTNATGRRALQREVAQINMLDTLGLASTSFGQWHGVPGSANAIGFTEHVGILRGLIESKVRLGAWKQALLANPLCLPEAYIATTRKQPDWRHA